jgi:hypothetical protein
MEKIATRYIMAHKGDFSGILELQAIRNRLQFCRPEICISSGQAYNRRQRS